MRSPCISCNRGQVPVSYSRNLEANVNETLMLKGIVELTEAIAKDL